MERIINSHRNSEVSIFEEESEDDAVTVSNKSEKPKDRAKMAESKRLQTEHHSPANF